MTRLYPDQMHALAHVLTAPHDITVIGMDGSGTDDVRAVARIGKDGCLEFIDLELHCGNRTPVVIGEWCNPPAGAIRLPAPQQYVLDDGERRAASGPYFIGEIINPPLGAVGVTEDEAQAILLSSELFRGTPAASSLPVAVSPVRATDLPRRCIEPKTAYPHEQHPHASSFPGSVSPSAACLESTSNSPSSVGLKAADEAGPVGASNTTGPTATNGESELDVNGDGA